MPTTTTDPVAAARTAARQAEAKSRYDAGKALLGHSVAQALKVMCKKARTLPDTTAVIEHLRSGPLIEIHCSGGPGQPWRPHPARINPDGTLTLHKHPDVDVDVERFMGALAESMPPCIAAAAYLPYGTNPPSWFRSGAQSHMRLRALYAAVLWAQEPDPDWSWLNSSGIVSMGVTPATLAAWREAGFSFEQALPFWDRAVSIEAAKPWLEAGETSKRAASLALRGETPNADAPWLAAGFSKSKIAPWRNLRMDPVEAHEWARRGFGSRDYKSITSRYSTLPGLTREVAFAWVEGGIPGNRLVAWFHRTNGDFDEALAWARTGLPANGYDFVRHPVAYQRRANLPAAPVSLGPGLSAQRVQEWADAGFPVADYYTMVACDMTGITPVQFFQKCGPEPVAQGDLREALRRAFGHVPDVNSLVRA